jgi:hypothetical protein
MHDTDIIYYDNNVEQIESLPPTAAHRNVDLEILAADAEGEVDVPCELALVALNDDRGNPEPHCPPFDDIWNFNRPPRRPRYLKQTLDTDSHCD